MGDGVEVKLYSTPDAFKGVKRFPLVLVGDAPTSLTTPEGAQMFRTPITQIATIRFVADVYFKDLRTFQDAANLVEDVRGYISGFSPENPPTKFYVTGNGPEGDGKTEGKIWHYQIQFAAQVQTSSRIKRQT